MKKPTHLIVPTITLVALAFASQAANAQNYTYSWGTSRVVNKSQDGLANPSGTYIGSGTLSKSAQGQSAGVTGNETNTGLPKVNLGAHIRTPGDNLYQKPPAAMPPGPVKMQNVNGMQGVPQQRMVPANYGNQNVYNNNNYYNQNQQVYYPGQNAQQNTNTYNQQPAPRMIYKPSAGGAATYGEQSTYSDNETVQATKRRY